MGSKIDVFNYILKCLIGWADDKSKESFSKLKVLKLLFFISAVKREDKSDLLDIFKDFYAMQYGPVESEIYNYLSANVDFYDQAVSFDDRLLSSKTREQINNSFIQLKNKNKDIVDYSASQLVKISHKWDCWINAYSFALLQNKGSEKMDIDDIRSEKHQYFK